MTATIADRVGVRRSWPSATAASCTSTATGCWRRSTRPRTRCRRRSCGRGGAERRSTAAHVPGVAVPDRHERLPRHAPAQLAPAHGAALVRRGAVAPALPRPSAGRGGAELGGAGRRGRGAGDDRARVPGGAAGAAAAAARRADRTRRARLVGERDGRAARDERAGCEQRAAAGARDDAGAPAGAALRLGGTRADGGGAGAARAVHRRARAMRRRGRVVDRGRRTSGSRCRPIRCSSTASSRWPG